MKEEEEPIDPMKKAELEMLMLDAEDAKLKHFDMTQIMKDEKMSKKKKRKLGKPEVEDDFKLNMDDSRSVVDLVCMEIYVQQIQTKIVIPLFTLPIIFCNFLFSLNFIAIMRYCLQISNCL